MDLFELQQRANVIVNRVNEYEANLVGTTIDETETLNQHIYADLFCLRPILKLLFGNTVEDKVNRILENDTALRLMCSSAPAWNSSFQIPTVIRTEPTVNYTVGSNVTVDENTQVIKSGFNAASSYKGNFNLPRTWTAAQIEDLEINVRLTAPSSENGAAARAINAQASNVDSTTGFYVTARLSNGLPNFSISWYNGSTYTTAGYTFEDTTYVDRLLHIKWIYSKSSNTLRMLYSENGSSYTELTTVTPAYNLYLTSTAYTLLGRAETSGTVTKYTGQLDMANTYIKVNNEEVWRGAVFASSTLSDINFESDQHEFVQNLDMYNNNNMLQLDVHQNLYTSREDRIRQGINYSYSTNIQDALVTESQVANVFKWNTSNNEDILNNTNTNNRQVPGIVLYYLGNYYDSTYTATIPYADGYLLNSVNYNTPPYYGAYYNRADVTQSQVGLNPGAELCRVFITGCTYTRGKLISPQQIWQPDVQIGDDNTDGFNWQGQAIYHELVFKNRRAGCTEADVDFIPAATTVPDNDPQGLATRLVLAKQKDYYYNRPWFTELNELVNVDTSKVADKIVEQQTEQSIASDSEYFNNYKLDYKTWAEAINKPL